MAEITMFTVMKTIMHQLNETRDARIKKLDPDDGRQAPEEAVQQVDSSSQVEGQFAVIPEYGAEGDLREHAADVLIGAAYHSTE